MCFFHEIVFMGFVFDLVDLFDALLVKIFQLAVVRRGQYSEVSPHFTYPLNVVPTLEFVFNRPLVEVITFNGSEDFEEEI